jgi:hypothetical protein
MPRTTQRPPRRLDAPHPEIDLPRLLRNALRSFPLPVPTPVAPWRRAERARRPMRLGEYFLALGLVDEDQLALALAEQANRIARGTPIALGDLLVAQGLLTSQELVTVLMLQHLDRRRAESGVTTTALGELLVLGGIISAGQLATALSLQAQHREQGETVLLGQILVAQGALSQALLDATLHAQTIARDQEHDSHELAGVFPASEA